VRTVPNETDNQTPQRAQKPPDGAARPRFRISPACVILGLVLLAFNFWAGSNAMQLAVIARDGAARPLFPGVSEVSEQTQQLVDTEVRRIVDEAHARVVRLLTSERGRLDSLAGALLEHETLDEDAAYAAAGVAHDKADEPQPAVVPAATAARVTGGPDRSLG
jgi:Peptidase family M41